MARQEAILKKNILTKENISLHEENVQELFSRKSLYPSRFSTRLANDPAWISRHGENVWPLPCNARFPRLDREVSRFICIPKHSGVVNKTMFIIESISGKIEQIIFIIEQYQLKIFRAIRHVVGIIFC